MAEKRRLRMVPILIAVAATLILALGSFYGCSRTFMINSDAKLNAFFCGLLWRVPWVV